MSPKYALGIGVVLGCAAVVVTRLAEAAVLEARRDAPKADFDRVYDLGYQAGYDACEHRAADASTPPPVELADASDHL